MIWQHPLCDKESDPRVSAEALQLFVMGITALTHKKQIPRYARDDNRIVGIRVKNHRPNGNPLNAFTVRSTKLEFTSATPV